MAQIDALRIADALRSRLVDFSSDDLFTRGERLARILREAWSGPPEKGGLISELWVEGAFPSRTSNVTLGSLVARGRFSSDLATQLDNQGVFPLDRRLYTHQAEAITAAQGPNDARPAVVVSAATGAGKTEAFLLPILDALYKAPWDGAGGVRCLILYPMNALVNDQVDRLDTWLKDQDAIRLFHFTSETAEDRRTADRRGVEWWGPHRVRTRQEARGLETRDGTRIAPEARSPVPDILVTNYSMLEYMLCRPQDAIFFGPALRAIVLDEAHLYTGTLAAEITLLLRRVLARCQLDPQQVLHFATSATIGGGEQELLQFATGLFSKPSTLVRVVTGEPEPLHLAPQVPPAAPLLPEQLITDAWLDRPLLINSSAGAPQLLEDAEASAQLARRLKVLVGADPVEARRAETRPAVLLWYTLSASPAIHALAEILWNQKQLPLYDLAERLWGRGDEPAQRATIVLLELAASARLGPRDYPVVPHRIHLLARAPEGVTVCLNPSCSVADSERYPRLGAVSLGVGECCPTCGGFALPLRRCRNCGEPLLAAVEDDLDRNRLHGASDWARGPVLLFSANPETPGERRVVGLDGEQTGVGEPGAELVMVSECPNCTEEAAQINGFSITTPLALSIVAETLLAALPAYAAPENNQGQSENLWLPARGRRLLAFSDSRQGAARLGVRLPRQHEVQVLRAAILTCVSQITLDPVTAQLDSEEAERLEAQLKDPTLPAAARQDRTPRLAQLRARLNAADQGLVIEGWADLLKNAPTLGEALDREAAKKHNARTWSQQTWEANHERVKQSAGRLLAQELLRPQAGSLELAGLVEITYPGIDTLAPPALLLGSLPSKGARSSIESCWPGLVAALCDTMRRDGAITMGADDALDRSFDFGGARVGAWCSETQENGSRLVRFVGQSGRQRRWAFAAGLLRKAGLSDAAADDFAPALLSCVFQQLRESAEIGRFAWVARAVRQVRQPGPPANAIRLVFPKLGMRRPTTVYRSANTGSLWPREVLGCAPGAGSIGTLVALTAAEADDDERFGRVRREYQKSEVFQVGLWADEHSAQLSPQENRRLQDLFKRGIRNVLSSTTTLELGIDIGGLSAVLMSNVPPGKAHYLQRAGRAGRRSDGSSLVVTFARAQPYDREVFHRLGDYLGKSLRRPRILLDRKRVVHRHLCAFLLGEFFRAISPAGRRTGAMNAFGYMGAFCGVPRTQKWGRGQAKPLTIAPTKVLTPEEPLPVWWDPDDDPTGLDAPFHWFLEYLMSNPAHPPGRAAATSLFDGTPVQDELSDWDVALHRVLAEFDSAVDDWRGEYVELLASWEAAHTSAQATAIRYQLELQYGVTVIEAFADHHQFLPHYGFPIGVQRLRVIQPSEDDPRRVREEDQYRLERGSLMALREYVPGSRLLVGGKLVTSHGLLKHWTGEDLDVAVGFRDRYATCRAGHFFYWPWTEVASDRNCQICGEPPTGASRELLFPKHGFSSAAWDPPKWSADVDQVGEAETATMAFASETATAVEEGFGGIAELRASYLEAGELLVYNQGEYEQGFALCTKCGYATSEPKAGGRGRVGLPTSFESHAPLSQINGFRNCWEEGETFVLRNQTLAARETTDLLLVDASHVRDARAHDPRVLETLGVALVRAGAETLEIDARELGLLVAPVRAVAGSNGIVIHDNTPGGSGHVRELLASGREWLERTRQVLFVSEEHNARCVTGCLDCLLSFESQHQTHGLVRPEALALLDTLLGNGGSVPPVIQPSGPDMIGGEPESAEPAPTRSNEERLRAARERRAP